MPLILLLLILKKYLLTILKKSFFGELERINVFLDPLLYFFLIEEKSKFLSITIIFELVFPMKLRFFVESKNESLIGSQKSNNF